MACRHEQPIALHTAKTHIGASLWQSNKTDRLARGIEYLDGVLFLIAHAPAAPQVTVHVEAKTIGRPARLGGDEGPTVGKLRSVIDHVIGSDHTWGNPSFDDIHFGFVGREREAVRPIDVASNDSAATGLHVETIDVGWQLRHRRMALVVAQNAERRIGEPDGIVGLDHDIVWRVERFAIEFVHEDRDGASSCSGRSRSLERSSFAKDGWA